ncbi:hypothetical protein [Nocardioides cavernaquae]|uniref:Uncharacterized protein n=1 Tax=Nocardioides cavernaquae TaxID=2321396 RepID=A0A3A5HD32_9ACTN|nr:hypothetical protein [Nocardioides cavernaquae]RJS45887.1 hypothetical protein D4739_06365 [Nocardioides cavernaquae]
MKPSPYPMPLFWALGGSLLISATLLGLAIGRVGPGWLDQAGAVGVATAYTIALSLRTGGRPVVFGLLALAVGLLAVLGPHKEPFGDARVGAAVMTASVTAVLAVMITVPAVRAAVAVREVLIAIAISALGAVAAVGFRAEVQVERFDYAALLVAFALGFGLVFRLGAGWHGLGRRGVLVVLAGSAALAVSIAYAEMLRRYGSTHMVDLVFDAVRWVRDTIGAVPRPMQVLVGIPALLWGCHMRARRRQGWWVCVFGCAATASVAGTLVNPGTGWLEAALITAYSLVLGLAVGYALIRLDLALSGSRGSRARQEEQLGAVRPEPSRLQPLL